MYDIVKNPIPKSGMWITPTDMEHLGQLLNEVGSPEEQRMAWHGALMALNLAHELVNREILNKEVFAQ